MRPSGGLDTIAYSQHSKGQVCAEATGLDLDVSGPAVGRRGAQTTGRFAAPQKLQGRGLQKPEAWTWISVASGLALPQPAFPGFVPHGPTRA